MDKTDYKKEYMERLLDFLDKLLYTAFLLKKEKDFENLPMRGLVITEGEVDQAFAQMHASLKMPEDAMELLVQNEREIRDIEKKAGDSLPFFVLYGVFCGTLYLKSFTHDFVVDDTDIAQVAEVGGKAQLHPV